MPETCIKLGELGARVMIENKEIEHYAVHVDPVKKEVSCWIASEAGKVRKPLFFFFLATGVLCSSKKPNKSRRFRLHGYNPTSESNTHPEVVYTLMDFIRHLASVKVKHRP